MTGLKKIPAFPRDPRFLMGVELLSIYLSIQIALPAALAVFPQNYEISVDKLEPKFQGLVDSNGNKVLSVFGNKGL